MTLPTQLPEVIPPEDTDGSSFRSGFDQYDRTVRSALRSIADRQWGRLLGLPRYRLDAFIEGGAWRAYRVRRELIEDEAIGEDGQPTGALAGWFVHRVVEGFAVTLRFEPDGYTPRAFEVHAYGEVPLDGVALRSALADVGAIELERRVAGYKT